MIEANQDWYKHQANEDDDLGLDEPEVQPKEVEDESNSARKHVVERLEEWLELTVVGRLMLFSDQMLAVGDQFIRFTTAKNLLALVLLLFEVIGVNCRCIRVPR